MLMEFSNGSIVIQLVMLFLVALNVVHVVESVQQQLTTSSIVPQQQEHYSTYQSYEPVSSSTDSYQYTSIPPHSILSQNAASTPIIDENSRPNLPLEDQEHYNRYWGNTNTNSNNGQLPMTVYGRPLPDSSLQVTTSSGSTTPFYAPRGPEQYYCTQLRKLIETNYPIEEKWNEILSDAELIRFLRARKHDLDESRKMLQEHIDWRKSIQLDMTSFDRESQYFYSTGLPYELYWAGYAYDNIPVLIFRPSMHGQPGNIVDDNTYYRFILWTLRLGKLKYGVGETQPLYLIIDRSNRNTGRNSISVVRKISLIKKVITTLQSNYPEILKTAFIVPSNTLFWTFFQTVSYLIDEASRSKVVLVNENDYNWWQNRFPPEILSRELLSLR